MLRAVALLFLSVPSCGYIIGLDDVRLASSDGGPADGSIDANLALCGDGRDDPGEACDDNNNVSGDGCSAVCRDETIYCNPSAIGTEYAIGNSAGRMVADGDYVYIAGERTISNPIMRVVDVSDPDNISQVGMFQHSAEDYPSSKTFGIVKRGDYLWLAGQEPGVISIDVSTASAPAIGSLALNPDTSGHLALLGANHLLVATPVSETPSAYDISANTSHMFVGFIGNGATVYYSVGASATHAFAATSGNTVHIADSVDDPANSNVIGTYTHATSWNNSTAVQKILASDGVLAIAVKGTAAVGVHLVDVSIPSGPNFGATIDMSADDIALAGNYLYIPETNGLKVYDISDASAPVLASSIVDFEFYTVSLAVDPANGRAYMAGEDKLRVLAGLPGICNATCGNNHQEYPEQCDDGNFDDGDGCEADCTSTP